MARISYVHIDDVTDPQTRAALERAILGQGIETEAIRAHSPVVMKYRTFPGELRKEGTLSSELAELIRVRVATSWERMFGLEEAGHGCHY